jgi:hypothetical protein
VEQCAGKQLSLQVIVDETSKKRATAADKCNFRTRMAPTVAYNWKLQYESRVPVRTAEMERVECDFVRRNCTSASARGAICRGLGTLSYTFRESSPDCFSIFPRRASVSLRPLDNTKSTTIVPRSPFHGRLFAYFVDSIQSTRNAAAFQWILISQGNARS